MRRVQVLGPGCPKCRRLASDVERAVAELGLEVTVERVTEIMKIADFGVMMTPALVVDGEVMVVGKVPSRDELKELLK